MLIFLPFCCKTLARMLARLGENRLLFVLVPFSKLVARRLSRIVRLFRSELVLVRLSLLLRSRKYDISLSSDDGRTSFKLDTTSIALFGVCIMTTIKKVVE